MLTTIYLKNFTVVTELELSLQSQLSIFSGETGAGKSIIVDAVSLCLGARGDYTVIRDPAPQCDISLCFDLSGIPSAQAWLNEHAFHTEDHECMINRVLYRDGRSRSTINGKPCPLHLVRELGSYLLVIYGQHQSQTLLQREQQEYAVDCYAHNQMRLHDIQQIYTAWQANNQQLKKLREMAHEREQQLDFLRYQMHELHQLQLTENEWQTLHAEHQRLQQSATHLAAIENIAEITHNNEASVQHALKKLNTINNPPHPALHNITQLLTTAAIHLQEASDELQQIQQDAEQNPERLEAIAARLTQIHDVARKHRTTPEQLPDLIHTLQTKITELENHDQRIQQLESDQTQLLERYQTQAAQLTQARTIAAQTIGEHMTEAMQTLGMQGGAFNVIIEPLEKSISAHGNEKLHFYVQTNPGQPAQPLAKIVSGGELSRIGLALQVFIHKPETVPTFIFDEIDVGIGGKTAEIVGKLLHNLARVTQVYCITHLPQIAAQGDHHYRVIKSITTDSISTHISLLDREARITELARMMSGSKITDQTLAHAEALLC